MEGWTTKQADATGSGSGSGSGIWHCEACTIPVLMAAATVLCGASAIGNGGDR
jgi:hypothetical protein